MKLAALLFIVTTSPSIWPQTRPQTAGDLDMLAPVERVKAQVPKDVKGREDWREAVEKGRCGLHEHGGGECGDGRARL